jgi:uncharacterized protein (TIGR02452 family)
MSFFDKFKKSPSKPKEPKPIPPHYAKRDFNSKIARENQTEIIPNLILTDRRVKESITSSVFLKELTPLELTPRETKTPVKVVPLDSFDCAKELHQQGLSNIAVLNMASEKYPGGGYMRGASAQEEALCRRSTLYRTINRKGFHPIPAYGGIYSPEVLIFRTSDFTSPACQLLVSEEHWWTSVISVAGIRRPLLTLDGTDFARERDREGTKERIRTILRIAATNDRKNLVLGAIGAGAFGNPPGQVAECFKRVFEEEEFAGKFDGIWFAIIEMSGSDNHRVFKEVLDEMEL